MRHKTLYYIAFKVAVLAFGAFMVGCAGSTPRPAPVPTPPAPIYVTYTINIPAAAVMTALAGQFPDGVQVPPVEAQARWDFSTTYHVPNVYWGAQAPPDGTYKGTGIVVAPLQAASKEEFTADDWPNMGLKAGAVYRWLGRFAFAAAGQ